MDPCTFRPDGNPEEAVAHSAVSAPRLRRARGAQPRNIRPTRQIALGHAPPLRMRRPIVSAPDLPPQVSHGAEMVARTRPTSQMLPCPPRFPAEGSQSSTSFNELVERGLEFRGNIIADLQVAECRHGCRFTLLIYIICGILRERHRCRHPVSQDYSYALARHPNGVGQHQAWRVEAVRRPQRGPSGRCYADPLAGRDVAPPLNPTGSHVAIAGN